ncbi:GIY-YIG nuclease family protein [Pseudanabaena sp. PCC 6802]|uniref:GIY-YIG nuclease family protein n=1 Tax=Pseudanabaena sp. PCC 6802 TaxID=118173 RepID=UPI00034C4B8C|nr:GIY-YIG nuclease family protein [Pseudanabaena sp. PCC 6802]
MRIFFLPSKAIAKLHELPEVAGIYYVTALWRLFYIGKATNLRRRWRKNHQRYNQFKILPFGRLHYKTMPASKIDDYERAEIQRCQPPWNNSPVPEFYGLIRHFLLVWIGLILNLILLVLLAILAIYAFNYARSSAGRHLWEVSINFLSRLLLRRE